MKNIFAKYFQLFARKFNAKNVLIINYFKIFQLQSGTEQLERSKEENQLNITTADNFWSPKMALDFVAGLLGGKAIKIFILFRFTEDNILFIHRLCWCLSWSSLGYG